MKKLIHHLKQHRSALSLALIAVLCGLTVIFVRFDIKGHLDGLFLLKERNGWHFELADDLYVGDGDRLIYAIDFDDPRFRLSNSLHHYQPGQPHLYSEWDEKDGSGFFMNFLPDGTKLFTSFGRLFDEEHERVQGLFVGGALPENVMGGDNVNMNESGMAYNDNRRWYHIWCNVNEAVATERPAQTVFSSQWRFLGSRFLDRSDQSAVIMSSHEVNLNGSLLHMDRYVYLRAGEPFFYLTVKFTNLGSSPTNFSYFYGDEPWLGNYGSSAGNVGWVKDKLLNYETAVDTKKYSAAGFFHYGNSSIGEDHNYTMMANFLEWSHQDPPLAYFANKGGELRDMTGTKKIPLSSNERFLGLRWDHSRLLPGQTIVHTLAIGMAAFDPKVGRPVKPVTTLQ